MRGRARDGSRRLAACILSRGTGAFALRCVESLRREWERAGEDPAALSIVVCDAAQDEGEDTWWRSVELLGARVSRCAAERSDRARIARAFNERIEVEAELAAVIAADTYFLPGSVGALLAQLDARRELGAVVPRVFLDELREIELPPPGRERVLERLARRAPAVAPALAPRWRARRPIAGAETPLEPSLPAGACIVARGAVLEAALASDCRLDFERALSRALRRASSRSARCVDADVLHHGSRWSGFGVVRSESARAARVRRAAGIAPPSMRLGARDLGPMSEPPTLALARLAQFVLELLPDVPASRAARIVGAGASYRMPFRSWSWLRPGRYRLRAFERASGAELGAWSVEKDTPARSWPLDPSSVAHLEEPRPTSAGRRARTRS